MFSWVASRGRTTMFVRSSWSSMLVRPELEHVDCSGFRVARSQVQDVIPRFVEGLSKHEADVLDDCTSILLLYEPYPMASDQELTNTVQDDKAKAVSDSSRASSPGLWLAFHDPSLDIHQALEAGNARLHLINANGEVAINLGITRRQKQGQALLYDYQLAISSVQSLDLNCDTSSGSSWACFVSLLVQFPTFERRTLRNEPTLGWTVR
jgi:hypothetical protein